ncbi:MAG: DUF975 family protein [Oscillibacter sp.]|nr:DUF975 family protein [Oscillibacter sp.]
MTEYIDRKRMKAQAKELLKSSVVPAKKFFALYLALVAVMNLLSAAAMGSSDAVSLFSNPAELFVNVLITLLALVIGVGCYLYSLGIRRGERMGYSTLLNGFSFVGRAILLYLTEGILLFFWFLPVSLGFLTAASAMLAGGTSSAALLFPACLPLAVPGILALYRYRFAVLNLCENPALPPLAAIRMSKLQTQGYKGQLFLLDLSYFGWAALLSLPDLVFNIYYAAAALDPSIPGIPISAPVQMLISGAFLVTVGIFFLPVYQSAQLGYFETAKRTSGVGAGLLPPDSPDGGEL